MKKLFVMLGVLVLFVVFTKQILAGTYESWREINGKLIYEKTESHTTTKTYDLQPSGVSAEDAGKLIRGELDKCTVEEKKYSYGIKPICIPQEITTITKKRITYADGKWISEDINSSTTKKTSWITIVFFIVIPFLLILSSSIINQTKKSMAGKIKGMGDWKLIVFYGVIIFTIVVYGNSDAFGFIAHVFLLLLLIIGLVAGAYNSMKLAIIGFSCGVIIANFSAYYNYRQEIIEYSAFISFAFYTSFIIAKAVKEILLWREKKLAE
ncbi:hypothetical protein KKC83_03695 [Patescibacteria group bacterium]|nr:hypothetical protein [Candidatus Falkowbacteria bacterium]MBU3905510.1 hypothetical protein [Patescibacteria group bacterium]MBU4014714.1 hypothetical protein [Patescibacteria group bacterium]MBU4026617.1 hypothetical protein [Patescibacteria group bacterium]MBU4073516.1 hypothetical protein [Patescibacteria group bacterium]